MQTLTSNMIKKQGKRPKLRSKAAECRGMQGFAKELALLLVRKKPGQEYFVKVLQGIDALIARSKAVDAEPWSLAEFQRTGNMFLELCHWLHDVSQENDLWPIKPKHHQLEHLVADVAPKHGSPNLYWCWLDESLGGKFAKAALRRGGKSTTALSSQNLMLRVAALKWTSP